MEVLIIGGVIVFGIVLFKPQLKILMRYVSNLLVKNIAETPEGAEAVYDEMIDKAQVEYNIAADTLQNISGQLRSETEAKRALEESIRKVEKECGLMVEKGRIEDAKFLSGQRYDLLNQLEVCSESIEKLEATEHDAREMLRIFENNLIKLKREKQMTVQEIILNSHLSRAYNSLDKLRKSSGTEKMLDAVEESARHKAAMAAGAKAVYEMKASTSASEPDHTARKLESEDFINNLISKYENDKKTSRNGDGKEKE